MVMTEENTQPGGQPRSLHATVDARRMAALLGTHGGHSGVDPLKMELLHLALSLSVPIGIADLLEVGGPQDYHLKALQERLHACCHLEGSAQERLTGFADMLMGGKAAGREIALLSDLLAYCAFVPGGVTFAGLHFEAALAGELKEEG